MWQTKNEESVSARADDNSDYCQRGEKRGLIVYPSKAGIDSGEGDAVIIAPPFTISDGEMEELISIFSETVAAVEKNLKKD